MANQAKRFALTVFPEAEIEKLKQFYRDFKKFKENIDSAIVSGFARSSWLSSAYYMLFSSAFRREQHSVLYGKSKYNETLKSVENSSYLLRRNIHRLEKGLIMKPRRNLFALDYIEETVHNYQLVWQTTSNKNANPELKWAYDVLEQYFQVIGSHPNVERARQIFTSLETLKQDRPYIPYKRDLSKPASVNYEQLLELAYRRRSVRWYQNKPVPRELIDRAITVAALSPSACNRQPFEFRIFDDPQLVKTVAAIPMGTQGFSENFPAIIVVVGKLRAYFSERDRHIIYIDGSLASMSLMYALETLGLSSCPINWPDIEAKEREMAALLNLEADERVIMLISVGYPDPEGMVPYSQKKPLNLLRRYN